MGSFKISKQSNGEYYFNLLAGNGQVILTSESYGTKANCLNGIESVKINSRHEDRFETLTSKDGRPYFVLKAVNGKIIGNSQMYGSAESCKSGIESVMKNGPKAEIEKENED